MTRKRKRLKKLAQSVGIQRNDFNKLNLYDVKRIIAFKIISKRLVKDNITLILKALEESGVEIRNENKSFKNTEDVLNDISNKWDAIQENLTKD